MLRSPRTLSSSSPLSFRPSSFPPVLPFALLTIAMTVDRSGLPALLALKDALVKSVDALVADEQAAVPSIPSADGITIPTPYPPTADGVDAIHASREIVAMLQGPMGTLEVALQVRPFILRLSISRFEN